MKLSLTKHEGRLLPSQTHDKEAIVKMKDGDYIFKTTLIRDPLRHREFFGILNLVFENLPETADCVSVDELLYFVKERITRAYFEADMDNCIAGRINDKGKFIPTSISFEKMNGDEFEEFTKLAYSFLAKWMGMEVLDLKEWYRNQ